MIREYVIEPDSVFTMLDPRALLHAIGPSHGRFVSAPTRLEWLIKIQDIYKSKFDAELSESMIKLKMIEEWLVSHRLQPDSIDFIIERNYPELYEDDVAISGKSVPNAEIITIDGRRGTHKAIDIAPNATWWYVNYSRDIPKSAAGYGSVFQAPVSLAGKILIIDPYFKASNPQIKVLREIAQAVDRTRQTQLDIICLYKPASGFLSTSEWFNLCDRKVKGLFRGKSVSVRILRAIEGKVRFHDRFLLTDQRSFQIGYGFEDTSNGQYNNTTTVSVYEQSDAMCKINAISAMQKEGDHDNLSDLKLHDVWQLKKPIPK